MMKKMHKGGYSSLFNYRENHKQLICLLVENCGSTSRLVSKMVRVFVFSLSLSSARLSVVIVAILGQRVLAACSRDKRDTIRLISCKLSSWLRKGTWTSRFCGREQAQKAAAFRAAFWGWVVFTGSARVQAQVGSWQGRPRPHLGCMLDVGCRCSSQGPP